MDDLADDVLVREVEIGPVGHDAALGLNGDLGALANRAKGGAPLSKGDLTQSAGFAGVSGIFRLLPNGTNERGLAVATIRANQVVVIDAAPRSFGGAGF